MNMMSQKDICAGEKGRGGGKEGQRLKSPANDRGDTGDFPQG